MSKSTVRGHHICDLCGKLHIRRPGNMYKITYKGHVKHFCGYSCYNKIKTMMEDKQYEEIDKILNEHTGF